MLFGATNQIRSYPDVILARFKPDGIHGNRRNRNVRLERAKGFGVAPGSQPISKKTGIIFHVLTANMTFAIWQERTLTPDRGWTWKKTCRPAEREENHEKGPRWLRARNHMENLSSLIDLSGWIVVSILLVRCFGVISHAGLRLARQ